SLITGPRSDDAATLPEVHIVPDRQGAVARGVEVGEIAQTVNATYGGVVAGQMTNQGSRFDIFVQLREEDRLQPDKVDQILVRNNRSELVSLASVVDLHRSKGPQVVFRE